VNVIKKELGMDTATLVPLSDVHVGHRDFDESYFRSTVDWMVQKGAYTILLGDMIDGISKKDRRFENDSIDPKFRDKIDNLHHEQTKHCLKLLEPLREKGLILGILTGNHETSIKKQFSYDPTQVMSEALGVPVLTDPGYVVLQLDSGGSKHSARIFCTHGVFLGGRYVGGQVNRMAALANDFQADIFLAGHTHQRFLVGRHRVGLSKNFKLETRKYFIANTGSFLRTYDDKPTDTWGSRLCFSPQVPGVVRFDFYVKSREKRRYLDIHGRG